MTNLELTLNQLAEVSATAISKVKNPNGMEESKKVAIDGGTIARNARLDLERQLGQSVISPPKCLRSSRLGNRSDEF